MSKHNAQKLLLDMLRQIELVEQFTNGMTFAEFESDEKTVYAMTQAIEYLAEAANRLPDHYKAQHQHIAWHRIKGMRNRLAHDYDNVNLETVWLVREKHLPELKQQLNNLLHT